MIEKNFVVKGTKGNKEVSGEATVDLYSNIIELLTCLNDAAAILQDKELTIIADGKLLSLSAMSKQLDVSEDQRPVVTEGLRILYNINRQRLTDAMNAERARITSTRTEASVKRELLEKLMAKFGLKTIAEAEAFIASA